MTLISRWHTVTRQGALEIVHVALAPEERVKVSAGKGIYDIDWY